MLGAAGCRIFNLCPTSCAPLCSPAASHQDATPNTCVTVCGTSQEDACTDACQRAVCTTVHQVPAWNEDCLKHCRLECQRGRTS